jgi:phenylpropionate dioxygenase-like ring-hydroxylating dioxygenase large terminal subunit
MTFVRNEWYVVALKRELDDSHLLARRVLGESVVLYRRSDGEPVALRNRCPHKGYPLSEGVLKGDVLACGYHGFRFDTSGTCLSVPGQDNIPNRAAVRAFPLAEYGPFVWIWPGDPKLADPSRIPVETGFDDERFTFVSGVAPIPAHHSLIADNVMDLSHESFIHATKIGSREVAETPIESSNDKDRWMVKEQRIMKQVACPPTYAHRTGLQSPIDRSQHIRFLVPSLYILDTRVAPAEGVEPPPDQLDRAFHGKVIYAMTPETEGSTHYFFAIGRDYAKADPMMDDEVYEGQLCLIEEDHRAVATIQKMIDEEGPSPEVAIRLDTGAMAARRMLAQRLVAEADMTQAAHATTGA